VPEKCYIGDASHERGRIESSTNHERAHELTHELLQVPEKRYIGDASHERGKISSRLSALWGAFSQVEILKNQHYNHFLQGVEWRADF